MGKSCSKIILLILILAAWIVVTVRAKKTEEGIILTDAYKKQIMESAEWKKIFLHTENYPDILSLEDVRSILDVRTKKTAARWLQGKGIFYFRVGREYRIPKVHLVNYFMGLSSM